MADKGKYYNPNLDLTIKDLSISGKSVTINDSIAKVPFNWLLIGKSSSVKTGLILNLMIFFQPLFKDRVIVFTKSRDPSL